MRNFSLLLWSAYFVLGYIFTAVWLVIFGLPVLMLLQRFAIASWAMVLTTGGVGGWLFTYLVLFRMREIPNLEAALIYSSLGTCCAGTYWYFLRKKDESVDA